METKVIIFSNLAEVINWVSSELYETETQKGIAKKLGISEKTYFDYKAGREPNRKSLSAKRKIFYSIKKDFGFNIKEEGNQYKISSEKEFQQNSKPNPTDLEIKNEELYLENQKLKDIIVKLNQRIFALEKK